ncbi:MAG: hypothetical protein ACLRMJ_08445 [Alistipes finegoldii]
MPAGPNVARNLLRTSRLQAFSNKFYTAFPSDGLYNEYWDNIIHNDLPQEMRGGRTIPRRAAAGHGPACATSTRCSNTVNCRTSTSVTATTLALSSALFLLRKIKRFGDVPWY